MIKFLELIFIFSVVLCQVIYVRADHIDPIAKTNTNKQTDLFKESVENVQDFENQIEQGKNTAVDGLANSSKIMEEISGKTQSQIKDEISGIKNIRPNDLNAAGVKAVNESNIMNEIYFDENQSLYAEHKKDAELIANSSARLLDNLLVKLKDIGVDCMQVKGNKEIEPEYRIQIEQKQSMDAKYDPHFCENLRNKYYCKNELTVKCLRKGKKFLGNWQYKTIRIDGGHLHAYKSNWGYAIRRERKNWDWLVTPNHPRGVNLGGREKFYGDDKQVDSIWCENPQAIISDARLLIAQILGIYPEQIGEDVRFPPEGRGIGVQFGGVGRWRKVWPEYEFGYFIQDIADTCEVWGEDWNEDCKL